MNNAEQKKELKKEDSKTIKYIVIVGKWKGKNGNTYHNAEIYNTKTKEYIYTGVYYGYDDVYLQTIKNIIKDFNKNNSFVACEIWTLKRKLYNNTFSY